MFLAKNIQKEKEKQEAVAAEEAEVHQATDLPEAVVEVAAEVHQATDLPEAVVEVAADLQATGYQEEAI